MTRFGRSMIPHFALDPAITYLNHGTVGAPPRRVLAVQQAIRDEIELQPSHYLLRELSRICVGAPRAEPPRLRTAAAEVAAFFGARGEDLVFVDNATTGANAVLRSLPLVSGDEILVTSLGYGAVTNAARYVARQHGASVREVAIAPATERPEEVTAAIDAALGPRSRLAIVDHIASDSALAAARPCAAGAPRDSPRLATAALPLRRHGAVVTTWVLCPLPRAWARSAINSRYTST